MCNRLHPDSERLAKAGVGYKVFVNRQGKLLSWYIPREYKYTDGWAKWDNYLGMSGDGFCFFMNEEEAKRFVAHEKASVNADSRSLVIKKIIYREGLGCHLENGIVTGKEFFTGICKEFKIVGLDEVVVTCPYCEELLTFVKVYSQCKQVGNKFTTADDGKIIINNYNPDVEVLETLAIECPHCSCELTRWFAE